MRFTDGVSYPTGKTRKTKDGYVVADVRCARAGIYHYTGAEVQRPDLDIVRVYRDPKEVFAKDSLATFAGKPVTDDHPAEDVTSENWAQYAKGQIGEGVLRDGEFIRVPITIMDQATIDKLESGKRELSMGYDMNLQFKSGVTDSGEAYDAVMTDMRMNHIALVDRGRAGAECRVTDNKWGVAPISNTTIGDGVMPDSLKKVVFDGVSIETTNQGAEVIAKLQGQLKDADAGKKALEEKHKKDMAEKDKEMASKDAKISDLEKLVLNDAALDAKIAERTDLIVSATKIAKDADFKGLNEQQIKTVAVEAIRGKDSMAGKSSDYVNAMFDICVADHKEEAPKDDFAAEIAGRDDALQVKDNGRAAYVNGQRDAWKMEG